MLHHIPRPKSRYELNTGLCGAKASAEEPLLCGPPQAATCWKCIVIACEQELPTEPPVPEHERMAAAKHSSNATQLLGDFLGWLAGEENIILDTWLGDALIPKYYSRNELIAKFLGISLEKIESEKQAMLTYQHLLNVTIDWANTKGKEWLISRAERSAPDTTTALRPTTR